ncbi:unnamed protein product [Ectocarpus sp. CCAP 1310/34]|nr:unnamed protein product [Ectocarpus sp. CCAP 1310/34]
MEAFHGPPSRRRLPQTTLATLCRLLLPHSPWHRQEELFQNNSPGAKQQPMKGASALSSFDWCDICASISGTSTPSPNQQAVSRHTRS